MVHATGGESDEDTAECETALDSEEERDKERRAEEEDCSCSVTPRLAPGEVKAGDLVEATQIFFLVMGGGSGSRRDAAKMYALFSTPGL